MPTASPGLTDRMISRMNRAEKSEARYIVFQPSRPSEAPAKEALGYATLLELNYETISSSRHLRGP